MTEEVVLERDSGVEARLELEKNEKMELRRKGEERKKGGRWRGRRKRDGVIGVQVEEHERGD